MAETAFMTRYRAEFIAAFEQRQSLLRGTTTTEAMIDGRVATFLVAGSGNDEAVTRGVNGLIPAKGDDMTQTGATLVEWHDLRRKTSFNVFASQGNQRAIMQQNSMAVVNRKIDADILGELSTGTLSTGAAAAAGLQLIHKAKVNLGNNGVPWDSNITSVITPAFEANLMQNVPQFSNADYVGNKPFDGSDPSWRDKPHAYFWLGQMWIVHPNLPGVGTADATCFTYHKSAIGHAYDSASLQAKAGYDDEQDYSWARTTCYMGSALLQNTGVVAMHHIDNSFALS